MWKIIEDVLRMPPGDLIHFIMMLIRAEDQMELARELSSKYPALIEDLERFEEEVTQKNVKNHMAEIIATTGNRLTVHTC